MLYLNQFQGFLVSFCSLGRHPHMHWIFLRSSHELKTKLPTFQREGFTRLMTSYDKRNVFFPVKYLGPGLHDFCSHVISYLIHIQVH